MSILSEAFLEQMKVAAQEHPEEFELIIKPFIEQRVEHDEKEMYTLSEICEKLNIKYRTFYSRGLQKHPKIIALKKLYGKYYAYPPETIEVIKNIWEEGVRL